VNNEAKSNLLKETPFSLFSEGRLGAEKGLIISVSTLNEQSVVHRNIDIFEPEAQHS
jgi:hypothetical protein